MQSLSNQNAFAIHGKLLGKEKSTWLDSELCMVKYLLWLDICTLIISKFSSYHDCIPELKIKCFQVCCLIKLPILAVVLIQKTPGLCTWFVLILLIIIQKGIIFPEVFLAICIISALGKNILKCYLVKGEGYSILQQKKKQGIKLIKLCLKHYLIYFSSLSWGPLVTNLS